MNIWLRCGLRDYTLISRNDYDKLKDKTICLNYVNKNYKRAYVIIDGVYKPLHRYILNFPNKHIDHIDCDPLNNTRENLRTCSIQENNNNKWILNNHRKSVFKGLVIDKNGDIFWEYEDKVNGIKKRSALYYSQKFAYNDYCNIKINQMGEFFRYKKLESFPLEIIEPRSARILNKNKTGYRGVSLNSRKGKKYRVNIKINDKQVCIGYYDDLIMAAKEYDKAAFKKTGFWHFLIFQKIIEFFSSIFPIYSHMPMLSIPVIVNINKSFFSRIR